MPPSDARLVVLASRIQSAIARINPDLTGQTVLTEAASGAFASTAVAAAAAGAKHVIACTRDSRWGSACDVMRETNLLAQLLGVSERIEVRGHDEPLDISKNSVDIVTNLGFVRPISREMIMQLPCHAAIALMWEPWEYRKEDVDLSACLERQIPIIATNEHHPDVSTFRSVGILVAKLLLECQFEILNLHILIVGSNPFGNACAEVLQGMGGTVTLVDPTLEWYTDVLCRKLKQVDSVVVIEHRYKGELFGQENQALLQIIASRQLPFIHVCGNIDDECLRLSGVRKYPELPVEVGYMTVTTAHVGFKPVVDLHVAGLHAGSLVARQRFHGATVQAAIQYAVDSGYGLPLVV